MCPVFTVGIIYRKKGIKKYILKIVCIFWENSFTVIWQRVKWEHQYLCHSLVYVVTWENCSVTKKKHNSFIQSCYTAWPGFCIDFLTTFKSGVLCENKTDQIERRFTRLNCWYPSGSANSWLNKMSYSLHKFKIPWKHISKCNASSTSVLLLLFKIKKWRKGQPIDAIFMT